MDPRSRAPKKNTSHGNEVLPYYSSPTKTMLPLYQRGRPCQDPVGNVTTWKPPDLCKETQTTVVWTCLPFIRSGQNHLARHSERRKKTRQSDQEVGRQHQGKVKVMMKQIMFFKRLLNFFSLSWYGNISAKSKTDVPIFLKFVFLVK